MEVSVTGKEEGEGLPRAEGSLLPPDTCHMTLAEALGPSASAKSPVPPRLDSTAFPVLGTGLRAREPVNPLGLLPGGLDGKMG